MSKLFGLWTLKPDPGGGFDGTDLAAVPVWQANLPGDLSQAAGILEQTEISLADLRKALAAAENRIQSLLEAQMDTSAGSPKITRGILPTPERGLLALLHEIRSGAFEGDLQRVTLPGWLEAAGGFQEFIDRLEAILSNESLVETRVEGQLLALSWLSRAGDIRTFWLDSAREHTTAHQRTLKSALENQHLMLEAVAAAARGAVGIARVTGGALNGLLALPVAWRFLEQVLDEPRR